MSRAGTFLKAIGVIAALAVMSAGVYALWLDDHSAVLEDRIVEWSQVVFLLLAAIVHSTAAVRPAWRSEWLLRLLVALLCVSMALREVDIDRLGNGAYMPKVESVLRGLAAIAWVAVVWLGRRELGQLWEKRWAIALGGMGLLTIVGCMLYATSWPFDKHPGYLGREVSVLTEETLQLNGTALLFLAAWLSSLRQSASYEDGPEDRSEPQCPISS